MEKVTVIIPCYNAQDTIEKAVLSALRQTIPVRVIVVDDCSTDNSFARLQEMAAKETRLTAIRQAQNGGPSVARNTALDLVDTDWVAGLDADDYLLPDRLRRMVEHAESSGLDFVADDIIRVQPGADPADGVRVWRDEPVGAVPVDLARFVRENIQKYAGFRREIGYLKPLMRTGFLNAHGLRFRETMRLSEDYDFYARSLAEGARWEIIDPCGYIAVSMPGSLSKSYPTEAIRKVLACDRALLSRPDISPEARRMLRERIQQISTDLAWMKLIDAVRARDAGAIGGAMRASPGTVAKLLLRVAKHFLRIPLYPADEEAGRKPARESVPGLGLT